MQDRSDSIDRVITGMCEWMFRYEIYKSWSVRGRGLPLDQKETGFWEVNVAKIYSNNFQVRHNDLTFSFFFHGRGDEL